MLDREDKIELLLGKRQVAIDFRIERLDRTVPAETLISCPGIAAKSTDML